MVEEEVHDYYIRHAWKPAATFTFNYARFNSYQNDLLDPGNTRDDEGQTTIQFFETILGFELLPSLEIGAGFGLTKVPHRNILASWHLVPVAATWRPGAAFLSHPLAYAFMTRASFRYLPWELNRESFGVPPAAPGEPVYLERQEGIWSAGFAVDLLALAHAFKKAP